MLNRKPFSPRVEDKFTGPDDLKSQTEDTPTPAPDPSPASDLPEEHPDQVPDHGLRARPAKPRGYLVLSRGGAVLWSLGIIFVLVWVFTLGVLVGRGSIFENQLYKNLEESLTGAKKNKSAPVVEVKVDKPGATETAPKAEANLSFYNDLSKPKKPTIEEPALPPTGAVKAPDPKSQTKASPADKPRETTPAAAKNDVKAADPGDGGIKPPPRGPGENFTIQVSAASTLDLAEKALGVIRSKGLEGYYYQSTYQGRKYFRIRAGRFKTRAEAEELLAKVRNLGFKDAFISALTDE